MAEHLTRYEDPETGELQLELFVDEAYDTHHPLYTRREQSKNRDTKRLRRALKIPMFISDHRDLHAEVAPPIVPSSELARVALHIIEISPSSNKLEVFDEVTAHMLHLARTSKERIGDEAWMLHDNFEKQRQFMDREHYLGEVAIMGGRHEKCE